MNFQVIATPFFIEQMNVLTSTSKNLIESKIELLKQNPYHFKKLNLKTYKLFRIRINLDGKESRLIYAIREPQVILTCILERKNDYNDLAKYLKISMG